MTKKLTRHDMKKPDEFVSLGTHAFEWVQDNVKIVALLVGAVLVVAVGTLAFVQYSHGQSDKAMFEYGSAVDAFNKAVVLTGTERKQGVEAAAEKLQGVYDTYRNTRAADYALLSLGEAQFALGKFEQAANAFEKAAGQFEKEPNFKSLALVGAGKSYEAQRNLEKALAFYTRANAIEGNPYKDALKGDVSRLNVYKDQMQAMQQQLNKAAQAQGAATAPAAQ
jgi:tetratricopeptide (TPR) repeat protein